MKKYLGDDGFAMFDRDFYPTPNDVIDRMLEVSDVANKVILEPSAGKGNIVDYLNKAGAKEVIVCEKEPNLKSILSDKKCRFLKDNFLDVNSIEVSHIDMIVMNPPFSKWKEHFLHAWGIAPDGCEIISLCNNNFANKYYLTEEEKRIKEIILNYGDIENFGDCFSKAERKTNAEIGCIRVYKPYKEKSNEFEDYFDLSEEVENVNIQEGLITYDFVRDAVNSYVDACKQFEGVKEKNENIQKLIEKFSGKYNEKWQIFKVNISYETFKKELQKKAWVWVLSQFKMDKYLTEKARARINSFVEKQSTVPFTVKNIYKMIEVIIGTHNSRMEQTLIDAFDKICSFSDNNTTAGEKWKTNSHYQINKKFIIDGGYADYYDTWKGPHDNSYRTNEEVDDIQKSLCYLTGKNYSDYESFGKIVSHYKWGDGWVDFSPFFEVQFFKKGSVHFRFKDDKVCELFNKKVSELKGWALPTESESTKKQKRKEQANETRKRNKNSSSKDIVEIVKTNIEDKAKNLISKYF